MSLVELRHPLFSLNTVGLHMTFDAIPVSGLLAAALGDDSDDATWNAVAALQKRANREAFEAVSALCVHDDPSRRERGARILAQFGQSGWPGENLSDDCAQALVQLLGDADETVRLEGAQALSSRKDNRCLAVLVSFAAHPDSNVRWAAVNALSGFDERAATDALIAMSRDRDKLIRDWAVFALGSQTEADYVELRDALVERLGDEDSVTRGEALKGLAARRDERVWAALDQEIRSLDPDDENGDMALHCCCEAVESLGDPRLVAPLEALGQSIDEAAREGWAALIQAAIDTCKRIPS
jgi:HEAT repeat protein